MKLSEIHVVREQKCMGLTLVWSYLLIKRVPGAKLSFTWKYGRIFRYIYQGRLCQYYIYGRHHISSNFIKMYTFHVYSSVLHIWKTPHLIKFHQNVHVPCIQFSTVYMERTTFHQISSKWTCSIYTVQYCIYGTHHISSNLIKKDTFHIYSSILYIRKTPDLLWLYAPSCKKTTHQRIIHEVTTSNPIISYCLYVLCTEGYARGCGLM